MSYLVRSLDDRGHEWTGKYESLNDAIECYARFVDHGFADKSRTVTLSHDGNVMATKELRRPA
jgi:hypothetical protein